MERCTYYPTSVTMAILPFCLICCLASSAISLGCFKASCRNCVISLANAQDASPTDRTPAVTGLSSLKWWSSATPKLQALGSFPSFHSPSSSSGQDSRQECQFCSSNTRLGTEVPRSMLEGEVLLIASFLASRYDLYSSKSYQ